MRPTLLALLLLGSSTVQAQDFSLILQSFSYHVQERSYTDRPALKKEGKSIPLFLPYNEVNPGMGIEYGKGYKLVAGFYKDSFKTWAKYAGLGVVKRFKYLELGAVMGGVQSPSYGDGSVYPLLAPYASISNKNHGVNLMILPAKVTVIALQYKLNFNY